jgi:hypothetical protein
MCNPISGEKDLVWRVEPHAQMSSFDLHLSIFGLFHLLSELESTRFDRKKTNNLFRLDLQDYPLPAQAPV